MEHKNILIVEDEGDVRDAMAVAFANNDYVVALAENGNAGYEKAVTLEPCIILLDLVMPVADGIEMLERLRKHEWGQHATVVILTAHDDDERLSDAYKASVSDYIIKSNTSLEEIVTRVDDIIANR